MLSRPVFVVLTLVVGAGVASARPEPSFSAGEAGFYASDIVSVQRPDGAGDRFVVQSTWRGDLRPGQTITVSDVPTPTSARCWRKARCRDPIIGKELILFLVEIDHEWKPATSWGPPVLRSKTSAVWIEGKRLYAFLQLNNPGPVRLHEIGYSLRELRNDVRDYDRDAARYRRAMAMPPSAAKARRLEWLTRPSALYVPFRAQQAAVRAMATCGRPALRYLGRILADSRREGLHDIAVSSIASATRYTPD